MSDHEKLEGRRRTAKSPTTRTAELEGGRLKPMRGQALVEYVLIVVLVAMAIIAILTITGPAIGNVFSNVVYNVLNTTGTPYSTLDSTQFWKYVTAVASYTAVTHPVNTNTPGGPSPTSPPSATPSPLNFTPSSTWTPSPTNTVGPSPTPTDFNFAVSTSTPFIDGIGSSVSWQYGFKNALDGLAWTIDYFDNPAGLPLPSGSPVTPSDTVAAVDLQYGFAAPKAGMNAGNYAIRASTNTAKFEARPYQVQIVANGPANVYINNVLIVQITTPDDGNQYTAIAQYNAAAASNVPVRVEYLNQNGKGSVTLTINNLADQGTCGWTVQSTVFHSPSNAWTDSNSTNYFNNSACYLRLRGTLDISSASMTAPQLVFWDRYDLAATTDAVQVGVHDFNSTSPWTWVTVHTAPSGIANLNWTREVFDLKNFGGQNFAGKPKLEVAFAIISDAVTVADGWYIDDVEVSNNVVKNFTTGYTEDAETPNNDWIPNCKWGRTFDAAAPSASNVWASNPSGPYNNFDDCSLQLNGVVDLTAYTGANTNMPQVTFMTRYGMDVANDMLTVEWQPYDALNPYPKTTLGAPNGWQALTPVGTSNAYVANSTSSPSYNLVTINLGDDPARRGQKFWLRFRLTADGSSNAGQGWFLDNIQLQDRPNTTINYPLIEPFNNDSTTQANWTRGGAWGFVTNTPAGSGQPAPGIPGFRSGPSALADSPTGNYSTGTTSTAELTPSLNMTGSVKPVMTFWSYWSAAGANLYAEVSTNGGVSWTSVWNNVSGLKRQLAWQRIRIDMSTYKTQTALRIRFRMDTTTASVDDGWYIDDLTINEDTDTKTGTNPVTNLNAGPIIDPMDSTTTANWYAGGSWAVTNEDSIATGGTSWSDSPSGNYYAPEESYLEYLPAITIPNTGTGSKPALYFWTTYDMDSSVANTLTVEVADITTAPAFYNTTWTTLTMTAPANWDTATTPTNLGWSRIALNLASYANKTIRLRFHVHTLAGGTPRTGIYIDDMSILDQSTLTNFGPTVTEDASSSANFTNKWIREGDWQIVNSSATSEYAPFSYAPSNFIPQSVSGSTNWVANYYHVVNNTTSIWGASAPGTINATMPTTTNGTTIVGIGPDNSISQISYDYSANANLPYGSGITQWQTTPATPNTDYYLIGYTRRYQVSTTGPYQFKLSFTGGARLKINGSVQTPTNTLSPTSFNVSSTGRIAFYTLTLNAGTNYDFEVDFYHTTAAQSGAAKIDFQMAQQGPIIHTSAAGQPYGASYLTSLIMNGYITIPANQVATLTYSEHWDFQSGDRGKVYYSTDGGFTWTQITSLTRNNSGPTSGLSSDWLNTGFQVTNGGAVFTSPTKMTFKFELDSRTNATNLSNNGWYIANIIITTSSILSNNAPTASDATIVTSTNTVGSSTPNVSDPDSPTPGDTFTYSIVTQPLRGSAAVVGGQLQYTPSNEFTGSDSFFYQVTDSGGLQLPTPAKASVTVNPGFQRAVDIRDGTATLSIGDNNYWTGLPNTLTWAGGANAGTTNQSSTGTNSASCPMASPTLVPSAGSANQSRMILCYKSATTASFTMTGLSSGVYSVFLYELEPTTTSQTYDISINGQRVVTNFASGSQGKWNKLGPWTVVLDGLGVNTQIVVAANSGGTANFSGVEVWHGGDYSNFSSADVGSSTPNGLTTTSPVTPGSSQLADTSSTSITVQGAGADIWGTVDQMRYVYLPNIGNIDIIARVSSWAGGANAWAKAGIMLRGSTDPSAAFAFAMVTQGNGTQYHTRPSYGATALSSSGTQGAAFSTPVWLRLTKVGNNVKAFRSPDGTTWTVIGNAGGDTVSLGAYFLVGFAVTDHNNTALASATFDNILITQQ